MATLVYRSLSGMAPAYLAVDCQLVSDEGRRQLRSAYSTNRVVRRTYSNFGHRRFAADGPLSGLRQTDMGYEQLLQVAKDLRAVVKSRYIVTICASPHF